jgi:sigma-B regulation protein RsbU (phosphoserine phosphatase)
MFRDTKFSYTYLLAALLVTLSCSDISEEIDEIPIFKKGRLDLSHLEFQEETKIELVGEWEFYYKHFYDSPFPEFRELTGYLNVPQTWQGYEVQGKSLPRSGYITLRGFLQLSPSTINQELRIFVPDVASAYRFYVNGVLIGSQGEPGISPESDIARMQPKYYTVIPNSNEMELVFHISNYQNNNGGFWDLPAIGHKVALDRQKMLTTARELFLLGAILIIGLYHAGLYFYRRREKSIFYFALLCLFLGLRIACTGNRYVFEIFPDMAWGLIFRLEFLSYYASIGIFILFIGELFPLDANRKIIRAVVHITLFYCLTLVLPIQTFTSIIYGFQLVSVLTIVYILYVNGMAVANNRPNSKLFLTGLIVLALFVANDIIRHTINDRRISLTPYGLLVFVFFQSLILSSRIASAFTRAEELSESLKISNESLVALTENLELMVLDRTSKLNSTLQNLRRDLQLAKKIQQKILPSSELSIPNINFFLHFQPKDEVGGDFYDLFELENGIVRFFMADATGHGIQAALYTMAIKSEYEAIKKFVTKTDDLMSHLNQKIQNKFSGLKIVFSCFLIDLDLKTNKLYYTSAGHPDQILMKKATGVELLPRTGNIIGLRREQEYKQYSTNIAKGDRIFLFTDGVIEQKNLKREEYGLEKIIRRITDYKEISGEIFIKDLIADLAKFQDSNQQEDDLTLLLIECI